MKTLTGSLLFIFLFLACALYAQPGKSHLLLHLDGGYADQSTSNGAASLSAVSSSVRTWNVNFSAGLPIGEHWEVGAGIGYQRQVSETSSYVYLSKRQAAQWTETKAGMLTGRLYAAYYLHLFSRLYFNPVLSVSYGHASGKRDIYSAERPVYTEYGILELTTTEPEYSSSATRDISYDYQAVSLAPAVSFFFSDHIAATLKFGDFRFSTTDMKWDNKQWVASLSPSYWELGFIVAF